MQENMPSHVIIYKKSSIYELSVSISVSKRNNSATYLMDLLAGYKKCVTKMKTMKIKITI